MPGRKHKQQSDHTSSPSSGKQLSLDELRALRMQAQCLAPRRPRKALVDVVKAVCGINAQLPSAMALSLRARVEGLSLEDVDAARVDDRSVVRTWCMRGTMHLLAAEDVAWQLSTLAPAVTRGGWRWLEKRAGLKPAHASKVIDDAYQTLKENGPMTRPDLMTALAKTHGAEVKTAAAGVVWLNGMLGRVAFGPDEGTKPTYVALNDWLGRKVNVTEKPDHLQLVRRYLAGYGPAEPRDLAAWWELPLGEAKAAWALLQDELIECQVEGQTLWRLASVKTRAGRPAHTVRLLPAFDQYFLGYHTRDFAVQPKYQKRIFHGGEMVPAVLVDGEVAGTWQYERRGKQVRVTVTPFSSFTSDTRELIAEEADDVGRFFGVTAALSFTKNN